jgi:L-histidine N-alpha-methyltransferase
VRQPSYVPFDVSEEVLCASAVALRRAYPTLRVHAIVGDYEHDLHRLPRDGRRLIAFLGSTIGNLSSAETSSFLRKIGDQLADGDTLLLGLDLVKAPEVLHAAYNDREGVTAAFNRNILRVLNRELGGDFNPWSFSHVAFYEPGAAQIEMHLRADERQLVHIRRLGMEITVAGGETIRTEISRKFTRANAAAMLADAGCRVQQWYESDDHYFGLALGAR